MRQKVVVIGHGYTSRLGLIRSLAELDCEITVVVLVFHGWLGRMIRFDGGKPVDCCSKYAHRVLYCPNQDEEALIKLLISKCSSDEQKVIIFPDSDFTAAVIDRSQNKLSDHFLFPHINHTPGAVEHWMEKSVQKRLACDMGLNVADGRCIVVKKGLYELPEDIKYPCFIKPLQSLIGGKRLLKRCGSEVELRAELNRIPNQIELAVLIEDYISIDKEFAVVGFSDGEIVIIPGVIQFITNSSSHFGIAREGKIMPNTGFEDLLEQFKEYVRQIGFCGLFDIDFYKSGGKMFFGEINLRFGGSGYAYTVMGANLPAMMVRHLCGESYQDLLHDVDRTATYVNERMCVDDFVAGHISEKEYNQILASADIRFVYDPDDPKPNRKLNRYMQYQRLNRIRKKLRK